MSFRVRGNSGYELKLDGNKVIKSSQVPDQRLINSANKQNEFKSSFFKAPKIYDINESSFTMEYINGRSFIDFFNDASKRDLDGLILKLDGYFKERTIGNIDINLDLIKKKLKTIPEASEFLKKLTDDTINIKIGLCHGDLTFSNMVFAEETYLIDFLDSYIESPTMDIVKLRQDTHLYWGFNMTSGVTDNVKLKIGFQYIDEWITNNFDMKNYNLLQCVNLFRIFPYVTDKNLKEYLKLNINKLCEHL